MAIILGFVYNGGFVSDHFFYIIHVEETTIKKLKSEICKNLTWQNLHAEDMRGQGYNGASNMHSA